LLHAPSLGSKKMEARQAAEEVVGTVEVEEAAAAAEVEEAMRSSH